MAWMDFAICDLRCDDGAAVSAKSDNPEAVDLAGEDAEGVFRELLLLLPALWLLSLIGCSAFGGGGGDGSAMFLLFLQA